MTSGDEKYLAASIGAVVCAAIFPIALIAVFFIILAVAEALGRDTNPVAGIMFLRISMTRAYPALLLGTFVFGLPIIWSVRERALLPGRIVGAGAILSLVIAVATFWSVGLLSVSLVLAAINTFALAIPIFLCFCLYAIWIRRMDGSSKTTTHL